MRRYFKTLPVLLVWALSSTVCIAEDWRNPEARFPMKPGVQAPVTVTWVVARDVQRACEQESKKRGLGGFGYALDACSFWRGKACTIITSAKPTMHELGHELRHCYQGNFH